MFDRLWMQCPVRCDFADNSECVVTKRGVDCSTFSLFAVSGISEHTDQRRPSLVNREAVEIYGMSWALCLADANPPCSHLARLNRCQFRID